MSKQMQSTVETKQKLLGLDRLMPDERETVHEFGRLLAPRLNEELVPLGFILACQLLIYDLRQGIDAFTSEPIRSRLVGCSPQIHSMLEMGIPNLARAIFPADFAAEVEAAFGEIDAMTRTTAPTR